jgi:hypothetical protein
LLQARCGRASTLRGSDFHVALAAPPVAMGNRLPRFDPHRGVAVNTIAGKQDIKKFV